MATGRRVEDLQTSDSGEQARNDFAALPVRSVVGSHRCQQSSDGQTLEIGSDEHHSWPELRSSGQRQEPHPWRLNVGRVPLRR